MVGLESQGELCAVVHELGLVNGGDEEPAYEGCCRQEDSHF